MKRKVFRAFSILFSVAYGYALKEFWANATSTNLVLIVLSLSLAFISYFQWWFGDTAYHGDGVEEIE